MAAADPSTFPTRIISLCRGGWLEAVASAHGAYLEVKRSVLGMTAIVDKGFRRLLAAVNLDQRGGCRVRLTEVSTKAALT